MHDSFKNKHILPKKMQEKGFIVRFRFVNNNIHTEMKQSKVSPQEAIGLLEMAKSQILSNLEKGRKEIFQTSQRR